jgi:hypothetical protein
MEFFPMISIALFRLTGIVTRSRATAIRQSRDSVENLPNLSRSLQVFAGGSDWWIAGCD